MASATPFSPLLEAVQSLVQKTSVKTVLQPTHAQVLQDLLIGLTQFKSSVHWREYWILHPEEDDSTQDDDNDHIQFGTNLRPTGVVARAAPKGTDECERFLREVEQRLLTELRHSRRQVALQRRSHHHVSVDISKTLDLLREDHEHVVVPTDKTNSHKLIPLQEYNSWMNAHLQVSAMEIS